MVGMAAPAGVAFGRGGMGGLAASMDCCASMDGFASMEGMVSGLLGLGGGLMELPSSLRRWGPEWSEWWGGEVAFVCGLAC